MSHPTFRPVSRPRPRSRMRIGLTLGALCALVLGVTTATVKVRLHRARIALRRALAGAIGGQAAGVP